MKLCFKGKLHPQMLSPNPSYGQLKVRSRERVRGRCLDRRGESNRPEHLGSDWEVDTLGCSLYCCLLEGGQPPPGRRSRRVRNVENIRYSFPSSNTLLRPTKGLFCPSLGLLVAVQGRCCLQPIWVLKGFY